MPDKLRIGLVGCGGMGNEHLKIMAQVTEIEMAGVCDEWEPSARTMGTTYGVPYWTDYARFLDEAGLDAVHICSPSGMHGMQGILAAERGVHVLCEKPLDIDISKVDRLISLCDEKDLRLCCVFQRRMSRAVQTVQSAIAAGKMGRILSCSVSVKWWRHQSYYDKADWRGTWQLDGGALANQAIHALDQMVWLAGPVAEVEYAHIETILHKMEAEDFALAIVRFANGARGTIEATTCCQPDLASRLEIYGTNGSASLQDATVLRFGLDGQDLTDTLVDMNMTIGGGTDPMAINLAGHEAQIRDFYAAILEHRAPHVDGREARASVDLLNQIYAKARPGQKIGI